MSDTSKATHNVAVFKKEGFVIVEIEAAIVEDYTEARALRVVSAHPALTKLGLPVLLAWVGHICVVRLLPGWAAMRVQVMPSGDW